MRLERLRPPDVATATKAGAGGAALEGAARGGGAATDGSTAGAVATSARDDAPANRGVAAGSTRAGGVSPPTRRAAGHGTSREHSM